MLTEGLKAKIRAAWGPGEERNVFRLVADAAWDLEVHGQDHDDQVDTTMELGILVGKSWEAGPDALIESFEKWVRSKKDDRES